MSQPIPDTVTVWVGIGNSDDKVAQKHWPDFLDEIRHLSNAYASRFVGEWFSLADKPWQNAEFSWEMDRTQLDGLRADLAKARDLYRQDSICLQLVERTELI